MQTVTGKMTLVDFRRVFWNGVEVAGVEGVFINADLDSAMVKIEIRKGDPVVIAELEANGIRVRRLS